MYAVVTMKSLILILICKPSSDSNPDMDGLPKVMSLVC